MRNLLKYPSQVSAKTSTEKLFFSKLAASNKKTASFSRDAVFRVFLIILLLGYRRCFRDKKTASSVVGNNDIYCSNCDGNRNIRSYVKDSFL